MKKRWFWPSFLSSGASQGRSQVVVDAIDGVANKCRLIDGCRRREMPIVVSGGLGGKADPSLFREEDMSRVHGVAAQSTN